MAHHTSFFHVKKYISLQLNWKLFFLLWGLASFGLLAVIPYVLSIQQVRLETIQLPLPLPALVSVQVTLQVIIIGLLTGVGLGVANRIGFGAPILADSLAGLPIKKKYGHIWLPVILIGLAISAIVVFLDKLIFNPIIQNQFQTGGLNLPETIHPPIWEGFLASFYGGFTEEILLRLFLMSLLIWIFSKTLQRQDHQPTPLVIWSAILSAALAFGLGHLPTAIAAGLPLNTLEVTRILLLNCLPGIVFGWLYWKLGLESAMIAHFSGDVLMHVIIPWLFLLT